LLWLATMKRPQKITFGEMRLSGARGLLVYCADYKCVVREEFGSD
jgi:hypothetical protein